WSHEHTRTIPPLFFVFFFFFQAEDGIRDLYVTGVQTCALPISTAIAEAASSQCTQCEWRRRRLCNRRRSCRTRAAPCRRCARSRSEERRVGKECRSGWGAGRGE